jgi:hypothetical protein
MPEEVILLEKLERSPREEVAPEEPDPFMGPDVDPLRGLRRAASRLYRTSGPFDPGYGPFAPVVVLGVGLLVWRAEGTTRRLVAAWAVTYVLLNLAAGGLPGPNLVRYNKDLEVLAPLACVGLGSLTVGLWQRWRPLGLLLGAGYLLFGAVRAHGFLVGTFVGEGL